jgi:two-component system NtrC family sensor kinase
MMKPRTPQSEVERIRTLEEYRILDTPPEPEFDALTELASSILGVPIALVSLVDRDRQWFKSKVGLSVSETAREVSFCGHAILEPDVFVVEDAGEDERFQDNPLVKDDPRIRFYAGAPLRAPNGEAIGTLCVIDRKPQKIDATRRRALRTLADMVVTQLELKRKNRELTAALATIEQQRSGLIHNSKMSALGEMAGGMAHEINNPLTIISGHASRIAMLLESAETPDRNARVESAVAGIGKGVERISTIIRGLQLFSRDGAADPLETCDLRQVVRDSLGLCQEHLYNLGIQLRYEVPEQAMMVHCRPTQISQILVNLLNNAKDAVKSIESERWIRIDFMRKEKEILLRVRDSGPGIPEELRYRIFEPFFSTKAPGSGTGLGLSVSRSLALANHAELDLCSETGPSCFQIRFIP